MTERKAEVRLERRTKHELLNRPYSRILIPEEDGTYTADMLEFSGCHAEGDTAAEAIKNLEEAAAEWIDAAIDQGQEIPPPMASRGYSGKINLRLPKSIHKQAARFAQRDDVSLNQFFTNAIAARVGAEELGERVVQRLERRLPFVIAIMNVDQTPSAITFPMQAPGALLQYQCTGSIMQESQPLSIELKKVTSNG
jgi:predicted RNase H-like HicB family nuclease